MDSTKYSAVLLDIEGTTTSISFVANVLFPYVRTELHSYLQSNWDSEEVRNVIDALRAQNNIDLQEGVTDIPILQQGDPEDVQKSIMSNVLWQMDNDRKSGALKQLQGLVYKDAYMEGHLKGHVYDDVVPALDSWTNLQKRIYIYSSGSVQAQKLLFGYSTHGNLCKFINGYFDTNIGPKLSSDSYQNICDEIKVRPQEVFFLTDVPKEAHAAKAAGLQTLLTVRPGNRPLTSEDLATFGIMHSFDELFTTTS